MSAGTLNSLNKVGDVKSCAPAPPVVAVRPLGSFANEDNGFLQSIFLLYMAALRFTNHRGIIYGTES